MKPLYAFFKKEVMESARSGKLTILGIMFLLFGIMNPAIAKMTPWMAEILSDSLEGSGIVVTDVTVNAMTSWTQFFKNIPMALIVFVLMYSTTFTKEYSLGTLVLILTKGLSRYKVVISKAVLMLILWTVGYWFCFGITYGYNAYFWDNGIAAGLLPAAFNWWVFGLWIVCLNVLFSVLFKSNVGVLMGTGGSFVASYLIGLFPKAGQYVPTALMKNALLLNGAESADIYVKAVIVTAALCVICLIISVPIMNRKQI